MLPYQLTQSENQAFKWNTATYIFGVWDKRPFCSKRYISPWLVAFINFILWQNTLALEILLQKFGLLDNKLTPCSCFSWSVFKNLQNYSLIWGISKLNCIHLNVLFLKALFTEKSHICRPLAWSWKQMLFSHNKRCFVNKLYQNNNEFQG